MKIEILQEELLKGLLVVARAVSTKAQLPVLSAIKIEALPTELVLSATDLEIGIRHVVSAKVEVQGLVAVPAKTFNELLTTLAPGKLSIELKEQNLIIKSKGFIGKIATIDASEFPAQPIVKEALVEVSASELGKGVASVGFASAKESLRPVLTGVLMEISQSLRVVATDGFRLAVSTIGIKGSTTKAQSLLVPARALFECGKILREGVIKIGYLAESKQVVFVGERTQISSQIIEGNFPDYNKILPKEFVTRMIVSREELLSAAKTALVFARDNSNMMRWRVESGKLMISSSSSGSGEGLVEMMVKAEGEELLEVVFNAKYVIDYLALLDSESVWVGLGGKLAPGMMAESESEKDEAFYVVMPINA
ncbi:MAG: DNA polymerase III subunit beta [Candidatus Microgenomates bacterium]